MKGIIHTGITVADIEKSVVFYRDVLGLTLTSGPSEPLEGEDLSQAVGVPGTRIRVALFDVGAGSLELIEYVSPRSENAKALPPNTLGAMHVAFHVADAEAKMAALASSGIQFKSKLNVETEGDFAGWKWVYFEDPDGITLELIEKSAC